MKEVRISIPLDKVEIVRELEEKMGFQFEMSVYESSAVLSVIVETNQTSTLLEELKGIGIGTVFGRIVISPIDIQISSQKRKYSGEEHGISLDEMISNVKGLAVLSPTFIFLSVLAGLLASFGLINDNLVVIIASMIIAPLLGPIALTVIGTMIPKGTFSKKAVIAELLGLAICVIIGFVVGTIAPLDLTKDLPTQILIRTSPAMTDIIFAIASGLAAGIFIVRGESTNMVGVAVAASLCPPAANVGVLLANSLWQLALGSLILLILNVVSIYAACGLLFWSSQTLETGGTISTRQYKKVSKKYMLQIMFVIFTLIVIITLIIFWPSLSQFLI